MVKASISWPRTQGWRPPIRAARTGQTVASSGSTRTEAVAAAAGIRVATSARLDVRRPNRAADRTVGRAEKRSDRLQTLRRRVTYQLADPAFRGARVAINHELADRYRLGRIFNWLSLWLIGVLAVAFLVNDGWFMYTTARKLFDVPTTVPAFDVGEPNNAFAIGIAVLFTVALLGTVTAGGKTLAWMLYPRSKGRGADPVEPVTASSELNRHIPKWFYLLGTVAVIVVLSVALHLLSESRFSGGLFASSTNTSTVYGWIVTGGPTVLWFLTAVGENPRFVNVRSLRRLMRVHRRAERRALRAEQRLRERYRRDYVVAEKRVALVQDRLDDVGMGGDYDWVTAAAADDRLPLSAPTAPDDDPAGRKLQFTGAPDSEFLTRIPHAGQRTRTIIARFNLLPAPDATSPVAHQWRQFKLDPDSPVAEVPDGDREATPPPHAGRSAMSHGGRRRIIPLPPANQDEPTA